MAVLTGSGLFYKEIKSTADRVDDSSVNKIFTIFFHELSFKDRVVTQFYSTDQKIFFQVIYPSVNRVPKRRNWKIQR